MCNIKKYVLALLLLFFFKANPHSLDTTLTGTIASRVITYTPTFGDYEYAKGFIEFQNGFTCTSDPNDYNGLKVPKIGVTAPVAGTVNLSQGCLRLMQDMHLYGSYNIIGANSHPRGDINFPTLGLVKGCIFLGGKTLFLDSNLTLTAGYLCFSDDGVIDGQGHDIYLNGGTLQVEFENRWQGNPMTLTLKNMTIHNAVYNNFIQRELTGSSILGHTNLILENVTFTFPQQVFPLTLDNYLMLDPKSLVIRGVVSFVGNHNFVRFALSAIWPYYGYINIEKNSRLYIGPSLYLSQYRYGSPATSFTFIDKTSELFLDNAFWQPSNNGLVMEKGTIIINGKCGLMIDADTPTIGGSTPEDDMDILFFPGARWEVYSSLESYAERRLIISNHDSSNYFPYSTDV